MLHGGTLTRVGRCRRRLRVAPRPTGRSASRVTVPHVSRRALDAVRAVGDVAASSRITPTRWTQRAAASSARSGPPTIQPAASASPAPVVSTTSATASAASLVAVERAPAAPRFRIHAAPASRPPTISVLVLVREDDVGRERLERARGTRSAPTSRIALQDERSTLTRAPGRAGQLDRARPRRRATARAAARSRRRAGGRSREPGGVELLRPRARRRRRGRGTSCARRPASTSETMTPLPVGHDRARRARRRARPAASAASRPPASSPRLPSHARAAAERRRPRRRRSPPARPARARSARARRRRGASGCSSRTITSSTRSPSADDRASPTIVCMADG